MTIKLLVVDDRADVRETLCESIRLSLPEDTNTTVDGVFPFDEIDEYSSYIHENDIAALLLDERLNEKKDSQSGKHVAYYGHDVLHQLRKSLPNFPVYVVTTYSTDTDLLAKEADAEDIIDRNDFDKSTDKFLSRIQRAASRFLDEKGSQLASLDRLTKKASQGDLNPEEQKELSSIRAVLGLPFTGDTDLMVSDLITEARQLAADAEMLMDKILKDTLK